MNEELKEQVTKEKLTARLGLLQSSDWTQSPDSPLSAESKQAWATYRQALRDLPQQEGFPFVNIPMMPRG